MQAYIHIYREILYIYIERERYTYTHTHIQRHMVTSQQHTTMTKSDANTCKNAQKNRNTYYRHHPCTCMYRREAEAEDISSPCEVLASDWCAKLAAHRTLPWHRGIEHQYVRPGATEAAEGLNPPF